MKKAMLILVVVFVAVTSVFASDIFVSAGAGFDTYGFSEKYGNKDAKEMFRGFGIGVEGEYVFDNNIGVFGSVDMSFLGSVKDCHGGNTEWFKTKRNFKNVTGLKLRLGSSYTFRFDFPMEVEVGADGVWEFVKMKYKPYNGQNLKKVFSGFGVGARVNVKYFFTEHFAAFATATPDLRFGTNVKAVNVPGAGGDGKKATFQIGARAGVTYKF